MNYDKRINIKKDKNEWRKKFRKRDKYLKEFYFKNELPTINYLLAKYNARLANG